MDFERLSSNIISLIDEVLKNKNLVNYIGFDGDNPSVQSISPKSIAPKGEKERILPYPFDASFSEDIRTQLHIYYPNLVFQNNGHASQVVVFMDIVVHKSIWLLTDKDKKLIRPYQIAKYLVDTFKDKDILNIGKIHFVEGVHTVINNQFEGFRLVATFTEF
ncbi:hypothetical protein [Brevibacillus laterosporus]|uniref:hypothetical protein n=1 Tax=Brevibacillus laterosporus TaxID=1465 RepID=UPI00215C3793|nr:hypothetical protein [Brevibacillus laterosporus]MCR8994650.1 hypothetical protein [Brevibacillus laterosporus]